MFCGTCGKELRDGAKFCDECGAVQPAAVIPASQLPKSAQTAQKPIQPVLKVPPKAEKLPKPKKEKKTVNKGLIIGVCVVLIVAILAAVLIPKLFPQKETIYVLVSQTDYSKDGSVVSYFSYEYDDCARLISREIDTAEFTQVYNDELDLYEYVPKELDGKPDEVEKYTYDEYGNLTSQDSDWYGCFEVEYEYDEDGRFVSYQFTGSDMEYFCEYDEDGNLISVRTDLYDGHHVELGYTFEYDSEGRLESETEYRRECTVRCEYNYDGDLLSSVDYYQAPTIPDAEFTYQYSIEYEYDADGRLKEQTNRSNTITYEYDDQGFLEESAFESSGHVIDYTCDEFGNIIRADYSDGHWIEREYKEMTVTPEQADAYRSRSVYMEIEGGAEYFHYQTCIFYYLIPNPRWETYNIFEYLL